MLSASLNKTFPSFLPIFPTVKQRTGIEAGADPERGERVGMDRQWGHQTSTNQRAPYISRQKKEVPRNNSSGDWLEGSEGFICAQLSVAAKTTAKNFYRQTAQMAGDVKNFTLWIA